MNIFKFNTEICRMNYFFWNIRHIVPNRYRTKVNLPNKCHLIVTRNNVNLFIATKIAQKLRNSSSRVPFILFVHNHNNY